MLFRSVFRTLGLSGLVSVMVDGLLAYSMMEELLVGLGWSVWSDRCSLTGISVVPG